MMYLILASSSSLILSWAVPRTLLWPSTMICSLIISSLTLNLAQKHMSSLWHKISASFATDPLASPLMTLSMWLGPLSLMASMKTMKSLPLMKQRTFISLMFIMLTALILTFASLELTLFYIAFETTLLPTLILMSRWGAKKERYQASTYFLFYTLVGSLPLLMAIMSIYTVTESSLLPAIFLGKKMTSLPTALTSMWWIFCLMAFMMKMPIYGFHLWLPKAHVEAPMAGSMILAAILLKLGGYGLARTITMFIMPASVKMSFPLTTFCMWGALMTSIICLRQTDLKALMAYSSVGHMSLVASGMFSMSLWGMKGALTLMIAHGLMSSALFCLAKLLYERNTTRTLSMTRGFKLVTPLLTVWWMMTCVTNLGLPPTPNLIGELLIMSAIMDWKILSTPMITTATMFGALYSLLMLVNTNKNSFPSFITKARPMTTSEHTLMALHLIPLAFMMFNPSHMLMK